MKKSIVPFIALTIFAGFFTSCKKDYECVCIGKYDDGTIEPVSNKVLILQNNKSRKAANAGCATYNTKQTAANGKTLTTTCTAHKY
ncbi:hypothetical protein DBR32_06345 [Taibaiella sp. KBW10]|uniref:hypothetical protein n=1 Tax=Taibaiella sp. KBW10 TaxID=2153357 RepID=UPI000F5A3C3E|nr:hypothetical protein [Taibaiella sp. KBW10]RQO31573.1 hypothetical protein DBR32_06345 [Taibaiella sp. KBW10]